VWTGYMWLRIGTSGGLSVKGGEFLDCLSDYQLLKKDSNPWT
jgi:hypothetical protein